MDDQTYQIALSPDLHISLEEFANAWNEDDIARTFAEAHLSQAKGTQFFDPMLVTVLLTVGTGVTAVAPPPAPTLNTATAVAGGTLAATTFFVARAYAARPRIGSSVSMNDDVSADGSRSRRASWRRRKNR